LTEGLGLNGSFQPPDQQPALYFYMCCDYRWCLRGCVACPVPCRTVFGSNIEKVSLSHSFVCRRHSCSCSCRLYLLKNIN